MQATVIQHPLFDPDSLYNGMRKSIRALDKMRGYFHWLWFRAKEGLLLSAEPRPHRDLTAVTCLLAHIDDREASPDAGMNGTEPRVTVLDALCVRYSILHAHVLQAQSASDSIDVANGAELLIVREEDGTITSSLLLPASEDATVSGETQHCRALLFEPEVLKRLAVIFGTPDECAPQTVLARAFQSDVLMNNIDVTRILCAVPEWEGEIPAGTSAVRFDRHPIPDNYRSFPPRMPLPHIVVVFVNGAVASIPSVSTHPSGG